MSNPSPVDPERLKLLYPPVAADPVDRQVFELGLVLGGTVSAGAYTAGALDFLLQALEHWHRDTPPHRVMIKTAAGSSGGAVCAAILGLLSSRLVPHVQADRGRGDAAASSNPLWDLWVNRFDILRLLDTADIEAHKDADAGSGAPPGASIQHAASLLNTAMIDEGGASLAKLALHPQSELPYFAAPFRVATTVANLRGIPYRVQGLPAGAPTAGAVFVQYDDYAWFAFPNGASMPAALPQGKREDEFWLVTEAADPAKGVVDYGTLVAYSTASGAMPVVLRARLLERPLEHYCYRPRVRATEQTPGYTIEFPQPDWSALAGVQNGIYSFTAVDGGTFNNDPVTLVHHALAGMVGRNPRSPWEANRAMLMIDPLANTLQSAEALGQAPMVNVGTSALSVLSHMVTALTGSSRYLTADLDLFADQEVFSRFQLIPFRETGDGVPASVGMAALAGSALEVAGGWCHRDFRVHDFLLGRANMERYLRRDLLLAGDNPIFANWTDDQRKDFAVDRNGNPFAQDALPARSGYFLPLIPLPDIGPQAQPAWPRDVYDPATLQAPLKRRLEALAGCILEDNVDGAVLRGLIETLALPMVAGIIADKVVAGFKDELTKLKLLTAT